MAAGAIAILGPLLVPIAKKLIGKALSKLPGKVLDGPAGELIAGPIVDGVAEQFGFPVKDMPGRVDDLVENDGERLGQVVDRIAADHSNEWAELWKTQVMEVNATMRAEHAAKSVLSRIWRPVFGFGFTLVYVLLGVSFVVSILSDENPLNSLVALSGLLMAYIGSGAAVLGVYVSSRSAEKKAGMA